MSVVEKTIRKIQEERAAATSGAAAASSVAATSSAAEGGQSGIDAGHPPQIGRGIPADSAPVALEKEALRAAGLLPPPVDEQRFKRDYRRIKRPLISNAFGKSPPGKGYLVMVSSAVAGEGKSFTSLNLALSLSLEKDLEVLLVDVDVAKPHLTRALGLDKEPGLLDVLRDPRLSVDTVIRRTSVPTLSFLPTGANSPEATELLASKRMEQVAAALQRRDGHRIVVFDTAPLLVTVEAPALAQVAGQIVLVVRAGSTPQPVVFDALTILGAHPSVSLLLNQSRQSATSAYYYYGYTDTERSNEA